MQKKPDEERKVRTSIELPHALWLKAKQLALAENADLRELIIEGLTLVLEKRKRGKG